MQKSAGSKTQPVARTGQLRGSAGGVGDVVEGRTSSIFDTEADGLEVDPTRSSPVAQQPPPVPAIPRSHTFPGRAAHTRTRTQGDGRKRTQFMRADSERTGSRMEVERAGAEMGQLKRQGGRVDWIRGDPQSVQGLEGSFLFPRSGGLRGGRKRGRGEGRNVGRRGGGQGGIGHRCRPSWW